MSAISDIALLSTHLKLFRSSTVLNLTIEKRNANRISKTKTVKETVRIYFAAFFTSGPGRRLGPGSSAVCRSSSSVFRELWPDASVDCTGACSWLHKYCTHTWSQSACRRRTRRRPEFQPLLLNHHLFPSVSLSLVLTALYIEKTMTANLHYSLDVACFQRTGEYCQSLHDLWSWLYIFWHQDEIDWKLLVSCLVDHESGIVMCLSSFEANYCPTKTHKILLKLQGKT